MNPTLLFILFLLAITIASIVTGAASMAFYAVGEKGTEAVFAKYPDLKQERWERILAWFDRFGTAALVLAIVPVISAVVIMGAGVMGIRERTVLLAAILGRFIRYFTIASVLYFLLQYFL